MPPMPPPTPADTPAPAVPAPPLEQRSYWRKTRRLTLGLLAAWFLPTFLVVFYARELDRLVLFGWPVSFYMAAQGVALIYLAIVGYYTVAMKRLDRAHESQQAAPTAQPGAVTATAAPPASAPMDGQHG